MRRLRPGGMRRLVRDHRNICRCPAVCDPEGPSHIRFLLQSSAITHERTQMMRQVIGVLAGIVLVVSAAQAQTNVRVCGTITGIDGKFLSVKSRDGKDLKIELADNAAVAVAKTIRFEDIKQGD